MTKIYEASDHILIDADYGNPVMHSHMAAHIIIAGEKRLEVMSNGEWFLCQGVCIPSGMSHKVNTNGLPVLVFLYDNTAKAALQIQDIWDIPENICDDIIARYSQYAENRITEIYTKMEKDMLHLLGLVSDKSLEKDPRILIAMDYICSNLSEKLTCRKVSESVCLSESRFSHLFREQVGMTFAAFVIYQRLMYVYAAVFEGKSITEAALEAGFSSSGHFADVNRRVFGLSASQIMRDCEFFKI